ncbi:hypothetical protein ACIPSE_02550 [Streptomyces sp. NPDC090106]|uniref:hypothetical protein n=1 Tax=Streptomyces sp. NPDC090106 TaxID=3365946 RepID=UPI0038022767
MAGWLRAVLFGSGGVLTRPGAERELYPEVLPTLRELRRRGGRMAVVADGTVPDLPSSHAELGIDGFFEAYAVRREQASGALELRPEQCLFVDRDPERVAVAVERGYAGRVLCRDGTGVPPDAKVLSVGELTELLALF